MEKLKIEYLKKEDLKPYANNAKLHPAEQIEQIKESIKDVGFLDPIGIWKDNVIIEGHGRWLAVMEMDEIQEVPVIRLDMLSDKDRRGYIIAHNKIAMNTGFDEDLLSIELKDLVGEINLTNLGFSEFEVSMLTEDFMPEPYDNELANQYDNSTSYLLNDYIRDSELQQSRAKNRKNAFGLRGRQVLDNCINAKQRQLRRIQKGMARIKHHLPRSGLRRGK